MEDRTERLSLLSELIKLAKADKEIREQEYQFLAAIAHQLEITSEEFKELFDTYIEFTPPKMEMDRIVQFQRLVLMMNVDDEIKETELNHIKSLGIRMGLSPGATNAVLHEMNKYETGVIPPNRLMEIFKAQFN